MRAIKKIQNNYVLRFDISEDFFHELKKFLRAKKISSSFFYGLGGLIDPELAFYDLKKKKYHTRKFKGDYEIAGLTGNSSRMGPNITLHAHLTIAGRDYKAYAGHLVSGSVAGTMELMLMAFPAMRRGKDKRTGLNLLQ